MMEDIIVVVEMEMRGEERGGLVRIYIVIVRARITCSLCVRREAREAVAVAVAIDDVFCSSVFGESVWKLILLS